MRRIWRPTEGLVPLPSRERGRSRSNDGCVCHRRALAARGSYLSCFAKKGNPKKATPTIRLFPVALAFRGMPHLPTSRHTKASLSLRRVCADDASWTAKHSAPRLDCFAIDASRSDISACVFLILGIDTQWRGNDYRVGAARGRCRV